ncbi:hypothetical protein TNCV_4338871 [Trichonephila clavipes]|nr:hypothetical protein TNCV_4338871 [Trichonephila clavipes]
MNDFLRRRRLAARTLLPPVTIRELRLALQDEWAAMPQQLIDTSILSARKTLYSTAFGDGHRNFEPQSCDEDDTKLVAPSSNYHSTSTGRLLSSLQM